MLGTVSGTHQEPGIWHSACRAHFMVLHGGRGLKRTLSSALPLSLSCMQSPLTERPVLRAGWKLLELGEVSFCLGPRRDRVVENCARGLDLPSPAGRSGIEVIPSPGFGPLWDLPGSGL